MADRDYKDFTIVTENGVIAMVRGENLPTGLVYALGGPSNLTISASAMRAMSAAIERAHEAQERAIETLAPELSSS